MLDGAVAKYTAIPTNASPVAINQIVTHVTQHRSGRSSWSTTRLMCVVSVRARLGPNGN